MPRLYLGAWLGDWFGRRLGGRLSERLTDRLIGRLGRPLGNGLGERFGKSQRPDGSAGFRGGLALTRDKPGLDRPIIDLPTPPELVFPLLAYGARAVVPAVDVGQHVVRGQHLADGVLASAAGTVTAIETRPIAHPSGQSATCVVLKTDVDGVIAAMTPGSMTDANPGPITGPITGLITGLITSATTGVTTGSATGSARALVAGAIPVTGADNDDPGRNDEYADARHGMPLHVLPALTVERLQAAGVGGLGGAGYLLHDKLRSKTPTLHTLVINAAECEPGLSCDEALMLSDAAGIVQGSQALATLIGCTRTVLVIETDKRDAVIAMRGAIATCPVTIEISTVAPIYPSGAERLTVQLATGIWLGATERPTDRGILCINVATALAAGRAQLGEPQTSRIVTVGGLLARAPCNVRVPFGTPIADVLAATELRHGPDDDIHSARLRVGGPLSGFDICDTAVPVTATINRIALEPALNLREPQPCIRCAACSDVCPVDLLPQELLRHARADDDPSLDRQALDACLECGCCDAVCPSSIPLTATFRHAHARRRDARRSRADADLAELRYRLREERLSRPVETVMDPVAAALARVRDKRRASRTAGDEEPSADSDSSRFPP